MNNYNKLINNLETLKLFKFKDKLDDYIDLINNKQKTIIDAIYELTELEIDSLKEKMIAHSIQFAGFPFYKTLDEFDFSFQPSINKELILDFNNLRFIERKENILFVGSPGVGKTHLATSIGIENARNNHSTYFITKYKLLIIDEVGYLPIDIESANMLFQLINKRYEKNSTIITTNKPFSKWGELFGDNMIANAILDRLLHHSHVINITGKSYRTKDIISSTSDEVND